MVNNNNIGLPQGFDAELGRGDVLNLPGSSKNNKSYNNYIKQMILYIYRVSQKKRNDNFLTMLLLFQLFETMQTRLLH